MKRCIGEANLEGQGWKSRLFTILLILTWEVRYPQQQKKELTEIDGVGGWVELWRLFCLGGANGIPWERKGFAGQPGVGENYTD